MRKILLLLTFVSSFLIGGNSDRLQVNLNTDKEGNTNPDLFIPVYWSDDIFSGIGYYSSNSYEVNQLSSISNSRIGTVVDEKRLKLNLLTYEFKSNSLTYAIGAEIEKISINKQEFGYFEFNSDIVATENSIEIEILKPNINADISYKNDDLFVRVGITASPLSTLDVKQTTIFKPLVTSTGTSDSSTSQSIAYNISLKAGYKISPLVSLMAQSNYSILPMKYDLAVLNNTASDFTLQEIEVQESTFSNMIKLAFNLDSFSSELSPSIGYGTQNISSKDISNDDTTTFKNNLWMIGFEGRF